MGHELVVHWEYQIMAFFALTAMSLISSDAMAGGRVISRLAAQATAYMVSTVPVVVLVYMLYVVSRQA